MWTTGKAFLQDRCPSCHPTASFSFFFAGRCCHLRWGL